MLCLCHLVLTVMCCVSQQVQQAQVSPALPQNSSYAPPPVQMAPAPAQPLLSMSAQTSASTLATSMAPQATASSLHSGQMSQVATSQEQVMMSAARQQSSNMPSGCVPMEGVTTGLPLQAAGGPANGSVLLTPVQVCCRSHVVTLVHLWFALYSPLHRLFIHVRAFCVILYTMLQECGPGHKYAICNMHY